MGSSKKQVIGYRYYFTIQMGIGRGPINELMEVRVGDKMAWYGSATGSTSIYIDAPNLFQGDKGEGGIQGQMDICMGERTQGPNGRMMSMRGSIISALRGVTTFVYDGLICSLNPYPKPWKFRIRRTTAGWDREGGCWYPERANIYYYDNYTSLDTPIVSLEYLGNPDSYTEAAWNALYQQALASFGEEITLRRRTICAMNPAHMLVEIATNKVWGRGLPDDQIDWDSFQVAANQLYCEAFGLCYRWNRQSSLDEVAGEIISTIGAFQYTSRNTGKLTLRLVRDDYVAAELPLFTRETGILSIESVDSDGAEAGYNEVVVKYIGPVANTKSSVRYQNLGSIMSDNGINTTTTEYLAIPDRNLAIRVAARDVKTNTSDIIRLKIKLDRRGVPLEPGVAFRLSDPAMGIGNMVMRVANIDNEDYVNGTITLNCLTDVFGLPLTAYVGEEEQQPGGENTLPQLPLEQQLVEATYRTIYQQFDRANFEILDPDTTFVGSVGRRRAVTDVAYELLVRAQGEANFTDGTLGTWTSWGTMPAYIGPLDNFITFVECDLTGLEVGDAAFVDQEHVQVTAIDEVTKTITIDRGCLDTIPASHEKGARIWFYETGSAEADREFVAGEVVEGKLLTRTTAMELDQALAQTISLTTNGRFGRPYPPGDVKLDGLSIFEASELATGATLTWARRNRVTQQDVIYAHDAPDITPEVNTKYHVRLTRTDTSVVLADYPDIEGTSQILTFDYDGEILLELRTSRDGYEAQQNYRMTFGANTPIRVTLAGDTRRTRNNHTRVIGE